MLELQVGESIKDVREFEGIYSVTNYGRVWSYNRKIWLKPFITGSGYCTVRLSVCGKVDDKKLHRLVGEAFIKNPHNKPFINHKNGDKKDCHYKMSAVP